MTWTMILGAAGLVVGALVAIWMIADGLFFVEKRTLKERRETIDELWPDPDSDERRVMEKVLLK